MVTPQTLSAYHTVDSHIFGLTRCQLGHANATQAFTPSDSETVEEFVSHTRARPRRADGDRLRESLTCGRVSC
jgi:hypothetical protein